MIPKLLVKFTYIKIYMYTQIYFISTYIHNITKLYIDIDYNMMLVSATCTCQYMIHADCHVLFLKWMPQPPSSTECASSRPAVQQPLAVYQATNSWLLDYMIHGQRKYLWEDRGCLMGRMTWAILAKTSQNNMDHVDTSKCVIFTTTFL